jgi:hypothetical protein
MASVDASLAQKHALAPICQQWLSKIRDAKRIKWDKFGQYAVEGMKFYDAAHDWMWKEEYARGKQGFLEKSAGAGAGFPTFRMQVNRVFEAVALMGPTLYHQNPSVQVTPIKRPEIPPELFGVDGTNPEVAEAFQQMMMATQYQEQLRKVKAAIMGHYLNWLQTETDKKGHSRRVITEAIVKGMGCMITEMHQPRWANVKYPFSRHVSIDDVVLDPDAEYWEDVQWIAISCCHAVNLVEREYGLKPGSLKAHMQSANAQGDVFGSKRESSRKMRHGRSFDLIEYWKVYSKNGFGDRLRKASQETKSPLDLDMFGDFCKIVVAENVPYPLNMPTPALYSEDDEILFQRSQWETPFWEDGGWPTSFLWFYDKPRSVWPISMIKPAVGELRFLNWCMSFLADKTAAACTTYVAVAKQAGMEIANQITNGMAPYTVLEISQMTGRSIQDVVSFLDAPNFNEGIWKMISAVMEQVDKRIGTVDLLYGLTTQGLRSATEANVKDQNISIRPDDMAGKVEDFLSDVALHEIAAAVWHCEGESVFPVLGEMAAGIWDEHIRTEDFERIVHDYDYKIAAGSARKPNKPSKQRALSELGQIVLPVIQGLAQQGVVDPWNAYISEVADTLDIDPSGFLLQPPEPQEGPSPEEQMAQLEMEKLQMEMQIKQAELQMKLQASEADVQLKQEQAQAELEIQDESNEQELDQDAELHEQEMEQKQEEGQVEMMLAKAKLDMLSKEHQLKLEGLKAMNAAKVAAARAQAKARAQASRNTASKSKE